jgi:hypothetical protein
MLTKGSIFLPTKNQAKLRMDDDAVKTPNEERGRNFLRTISKSYFDGLENQGFLPRR